MNQRFDRLAHAVARAAGSAWAFLASLALIVVWAIAGPLFGFSDTWQLWANTATTIITFLMVFLIQNTQNRDTDAVQLKLDELLRAVGTARTELARAEEMTEQELKERTEEIKREATRGDGGAERPRP